MCTGHMGETSSWYFLWKSPLCNSHLSREWIQGSAWWTITHVSSTTFLFWDERLRCFWIRLQSFQKFSLLEGQQRNRTGLKRTLNISGNKQVVGKGISKPVLEQTAQLYQALLLCFQVKIWMFTVTNNEHVEIHNRRNLQSAPVGNRFKVSHQNSGQSLSWKGQLAARGQTWI